MPTTSKRPRRLSDEDLQQVLIQHGVIARARHVQPRGDDSVIKLRPVVPDELPAGSASPEPDRGGGVILGPINLLKLKFSPGDYGRRPVAEPWFYPDGSQILELSTKCALSEAFQAAVETRTFLARQGVDLSGKQQTKTKTALRFFARSLKVTADA